MTVEDVDCFLLDMFCTIAAIPWDIAYVSNSYGLLVCIE